MRKLLRRTRPRTRAVAVLLVVLVAGAGVYWFGVRDTTAAAATPAATTQSVAASLTTMEQSVAASGTLAPTVQEDVNFAASGTVTTVPVAVGQQVTAGQTLATIDTLTLNAGLLQAKATLASAQAKLSDSEDDADGTDESDAQIAANSAAVDVAQAAVDEATVAMADATLVAPVAGLLTTVGVAVGDAVTGSGSSGSSASGSTGSTGTSTGSTGASTGAATTATSSAQFTIVGTDTWEVDVTVDDADVALIAVADQAEITLDGADAPVFGTVSEIGLISTATSGVAAYPVVIAVTGSPEGLYDGVAADVVIVYERRTDVLTVPSAAVRTVDGESTVTQAGADGADVTTVVTVGATVDSMTEILTGLVEGDEVIVTVVQTSQQSTTTGDDAQERMMGELPEGFTPGEMPAGMGPGGQTNG